MNTGSFPFPLTWSAVADAVQIGTGTVVPDVGDGVGGSARLQLAAERRCTASMLGLMRSRRRCKQWRKATSGSG
jgi:hypothetical protein